MRREVLRGLVGVRSNRGRFMLDTFVTPSFYGYLSSVIKSMEALEDTVLPILHPYYDGKERNRRAVDLHLVERNVRFRSWVRAKYMELKFGSTPRLAEANAVLYPNDDLMAIPKLSQVKALFDMEDWNVNPDYEENEIQRRLVRAYESDDPSLKKWGLEELLECLGCCVMGMNEFNLYCEQNEIYEFLTQPYVNMLSRYLLQRCSEIAERKVSKLGEDMGRQITILEVGAGSGQLGNAIDKYRMNHGKKQTKSVSIVVTDSGRWRLRRSCPVLQMDYKDALYQFEPDIVLAQWMPMGEDWTQAFRDEPNVEEYILIGEKDDGCCGHPWLTWGVKIDDSNDPMFEKNQDYNPHGMALDIFHWLSKDRKPEPKNDSSADKEIPPFVRDGFEKQVLMELSQYQLSRYDRKVYANNTFTVSFKRTNT